MIKTKEIVNNENVIKDITTDDLVKLFKEYNKLYFNDELPLPKLRKMGKTSYSHNTWGHFTILGNDEYSIEINLSSNILWTESTLRNTLVHEMIHYSHQLKYGYIGGVHHLPPFVTTMVSLNFKHKELDIRCHFKVPLKNPFKRVEEKQGVILYFFGRLFLLWIYCVDTTKFLYRRTKKWLGC